MKTNKLRIAIVLAMFFLPLLLKAQWKAVRFDNENIFEKIVAVTSTTVFVIGIEPASYEYFMLKSNDAGATWDSIGLNTPVDKFQLSEIFFTDMNNGFVGGMKNNKQVLLKTTDNGITWANVTPDSSSLNAIVSVYFVDPQNGFVAEGSTLYKTIDGGMNWTSKTLPFEISNLYFENIYTGFISGHAALSGVVMKTVDGGQNWQPLLSVYDNNLFYPNFKKLNVVDQNLAYTSLDNTNKLFRTKNEGASWDTIVVDSVWSITDFCFMTEDTGHLLSSMGQIYVTYDAGKSWKLEYATDWKFYGPSVYLNSFSFIDRTGFVAGSNGLIKKYTANTATGINQANRKESMVIYPNPFSTSATIRIADYSELLSGRWGFTVYDSFGKKVLQSEIYEPQFEMQRGNLNNGIYFYRVSNERNETVWKGKMVIQ